MNVLVLGDSEIDLVVFATLKEREGYKYYSHDLLQLMGIVVLGF